VVAGREVFSGCRNEKKEEDELAQRLVRAATTEQTLTHEGS
jgi:hypothetical protein